MRTVQIIVSEADFQKYRLENDRGKLKFEELVEKISLEYARKALLDCNELAEQSGLSKMTLDDINAEIKAVRKAKTNS
jgi:hypothetical protein